MGGTRATAPHHGGSGAQMGRGVSSPRATINKSRVKRMPPPPTAAATPGSPGGEARVPRPDSLHQRLQSSPSVASGCGC